ncbi:E3 ubiquitin-protein ligase MARCH5 [Hypsizygus marmoreus]|uniref:E3 ubiquitin-protein ligase MARCH5 n=1 Tax=Hypsizygus marmoreus TaxID=39966 RepID=A0A369JWW7_HYPMA|nr:E3 ubiquitin-protein ligase MARCH5 [Hypsizygus marmoreus]
MSRRRIPTVDDLRVKLCYICREEELYDSKPEGPPRAWTHPCKCTLVAHESCLLKWIQTSQGDASRAPNALKCPQCGSQYELESQRPLILRLLGSGNRALGRMGRLFTLATAAGCVAVFTSGVYILFTAYGAYAIRKFIGREMYDILLTDDPANWPWTAFLNLPSLTLSLILSRFQSSHQIPTLIPLLLVWPPSTPVGARSPLSLYSSSLFTPSSLPAHHQPHWPPSPVVFGLFLVPLTRMVYRRCFGMLQYWLLGAQPPSARERDAGRGWVWQEGDVPWRIRIRANVDVVEPEQEQEQAQAQDVGDAQRHIEAQGELGEGDHANAPPEGIPAAEPQAQEPNAAAVEAAEQLIEIDTASLGRRVGGALLIPGISSAMGSLLYRLAKHSRALRQVLGVRPPLPGGAYLSPWAGMGLGMGIGGFGAGGGMEVRHWEGLGWVKRLGVTLRLILNATWHGTRTWAEADPVWWRNSIGLGLFVVAKDCIQLLHLWLAKRELESRHVKNRDFAGVDIKELDLVPSFPRDL